MRIDPPQPVPQTITRCPFCHETVSVFENGIQCRGCQGVSHQACWEEHGRCASCGSNNMRRPDPHLTERQQTVLETATRLWTAYMEGPKAISKTDKPEHWARMAKELVDKVLEDPR